MGFAATTYVGYKFEHTNRRRLRSGWLVKGTVYWTLGPETFAQWDAFLQNWDAQGYKIGLLLKNGQTIRKLLYGGVSLPPVPHQAKEVADLHATHGTPDNYRWHVRGRRAKREHTIIPPNIVTFPIELTLSGGQTPQMIPVASRHLEGSFAQSMAGLWVVRPRRSAARRRGYAGRRRARR